jgi:uncharacterized protein (DUF983 family)
MSLINFFKTKCPKCENGKIYHGFYLKARMNEKCPSCQLKFEKEPGFFFGAMYVSYAMSIAECVTVFVICGFFTGDYFNALSLIPITLTLLIMLPINLKWSRIAWIYLFIKKDKDI